MVGFPFLFYGLFFLALVFSGRVASPGRGLAGQARLRLGQVGALLVLPAVIYLFASLLVHVKDFTDFFTSIMPRTPSFIFRGALLFLTTMALLYGIEVLGRVALFLLPAVILFLLGGILGNLPSFEPGNLLPFMERGWDPLIKSGFLQISYTSELFALGFLAAFPGYSGREVRRASYLGLLMVVGLFFLISIFLFGVMGESYTIRSNFKLFSLFQYGLKNSTTGFESLFIVVWVTVFFVKSALLQGAIGTALGEITPLKPGLYHITAGIAAFIITFFVFNNRMELLQFYTGIYPPVSLSFTLSFLLLLYLFSGKDKRAANK
ncbi:MAG: spore germination protein [Peptococcaceae bacterium]|nr:spore germination protein [Peptococcaceae bacterium]